MYEYKANVVKVYDGDTITVDFDLGLDVWLKGQTIRLYGIDTPELRGDEREQGIVVRDYLRGLILGKEVIIHTYKDKKGKYGRWLGIVHAEEIGNVNEHLVKMGYAEVYEE